MTTPTTGIDRDAGVRALSEQLPRLMRVIHGLKQQAAAQSGREGAALVLLFPLSRVGPLRQSALADLVHADPSTVSRHVAALVERGLLQRIPDESDGRASKLVVTDAGRNELEKMRAEREAGLRRVTADWSDDEVATFTTLFDRLLDGLAAGLPSDPMTPPAPGR